MPIKRVRFYGYDLTNKRTYFDKCVYFHKRVYFNKCVRFDEMSLCFSQVHACVSTK
jgi:hypothetical protein